MTKAKKTPTHTFTQRQTMLDSFYEFYHYHDSTPLLVDYHSHDFYEILFFIQGDVSYSLEGRTVRLRPGDILFIHPSDIHRVESVGQKSYERYVLWIAPSFIENSKAVGEDLSLCFRDAKEKQHRLIRSDGETFAYIQHLCERAQRRMLDKGFGSKNLCYGAINDLLVYLNRAYFEINEWGSEDITENEMINEMVNYLEENIQEEITLESLAGAFYVSKFHMERTFKEYTGLPIYQFIRKKRLGLARRLLLSGRSVREVCHECGFNDYSNFLRAFRKEYGDTPKHFQLENLSGGEIVAGAK